MRIGIICCVLFTLLFVLFFGRIANAAVSVDVTYTAVKVGTTSFVEAFAMDYDRLNNILFITGNDFSTLAKFYLNGTFLSFAYTYPDNPFGVAVNSTLFYYSIMGSGIYTWDGSPGGASNIVIPNGVSGSDGVPAISSSTDTPKYMRMSPKTGDLFFTEASRVRRISSGYVYAFAGSGTIGSSSGDGGPATSATFAAAPRHIAITPEDELIIADTSNIRKVYKNNTINTILNVANTYGLAVGDNGDIYVLGATTIRKYRNGVLSTICGSGGSGGTLVGSFDFTNTTNDASNIKLSYTGVSDLVVGANNSIYFNTGKVVVRLEPRCTSGYALSSDHTVCYPICYGTVGSSQSVCSNNGSCIAPNTCSCNSGYTGSKCEIPICYGYQADDANVCSGNGTCISKDNCVCKTNYFGLACNITTCSSITSTNNNVCSSRGSCISYDTCKCSQNYYYGKDCQNTYCYSVSSTDSNVCSGHGTCSDYNQCSCTSGWYGSYCNITECFSVLSNSSDVCSRAGTCISPNNCTCAAGYNGTNCENFDCFGVSVLSGQSACKNNGTCSGPGSCSCLPTYYGKTCDISTCYGILSNYSNVCSGHGSCQMLDTCDCSDNYYGKNCSFPICYGITYDNSSVCSARGKCTAGNTCACNSGYASGNCQLNICYGINSDQSTVCSSRGSCGAPNSCQCNSGYRGPNCQYVEMVMDAKTAVLSTAASSTLASYAPTTATSCSAIFSSKDLSYLGGSDTARCIWNQNMFKIYLGFRHFVYDNMTMDIVGNGMNFTLQIVLTKAIQDSSSSSSTSILPQLTALPKASIIIKSYTPPTFQAFRNTSLVWSCSGCDPGLATLLAAMSDKPVVVIPSSYLGSGTSFSLTVTSKNWLGNTNTSSKVDIVYDSTSPYYFDFVSETSGSQFTCSGFDCIIEVNQYVGTGPLVSFASSFAALNSDSGDYLIRFLNRYSTSTILDSFYDGTMKIQPSSSINALTYAMSYTSFEEVPIVLLNTEKQYYGNTLTVTASFIDPAIVYLSNSITYEWQCSQSSSKDGSYSPYECVSPTTELIIPESKTILGEYHLIKVSVTLKNSKIVTTTKSATVQIVKTNIPDILFDAIPPVYPPSRSLVLNAVISSSTKIGSVTWQVTKGNLLYTNVLNQATNQALDGYNIKSTLVIDKSYLLQGDSYTFTVTASNDVGTGSASVSSVIDVAPRITCQAYSTTSSILYAYTSDVVVDCVSLSDYSITSYHVDVYTDSTRVMTVSKSMKKSFLTKLPYGPSGNVRLDIRAVNKIGSVSSTSLDLKVSLPNSDNSFLGRINFANSEYESIKSTLTRLDSVPTMHSLLLLVIQQNSTSEFANLEPSPKATLTTLITNMLTTLNNLKAISSNADDKLAPVFIPFTNDAYKLLAVVSSATVASNTNLLGWVQFFVSSFNNVKSYYRSTLVSTIYDSKHLTEIESLIDIGSKYISADQFTPYYKETAIIARLINDVTNSTTTTSTIVDSSGSETRFDFVDRIQQLNSKTITFTNYPSISITFPSDFYTQLGYSNTGSGVTLTSSVSTTKYSQSLSPVVDISLSTSSGSAISVSGLQSNLIQINYGSLTQSKANYTSLNYTCRFLNTSSSQWSLSGVSSSVSVLSDDGQTVTFSLACSTSHLTAFGVLSAAIPKTSQSKSVTTDNTGVIVGAVLGTLLPLILIAVIVVVVVIIIVILYKRKQSIDTSKVQDVELVNKNVSSVYISDFPSEESTHFKQLVSVSSGSTSTDPLSRYIDMVKIGQGAFGSVFKGADTKQGGKLKAIKVIRFNSVGELNNMLKEGTMLMNIDHPHILKVNEFIIDKDNILCIDTDFCEDGDLTKLTLSPEPIPEPIIKQVIYQMCSALSFIHTKLKIIHRDVKPHNIFLKELTDFSVQTVLADFGLAKQDQNNSMNSYAGTPLYMSPELALGGKYNYNTDTWSLGVVAYQLMTKDITTALSHLCLTGDSADTRNKIKAKLDGAGEYSEALKEVVLTMLEKDAASRPYPQELIDRPFFQDYRPKKKKNNIFRSSSAGEEDMYM